MSLSRDLFRLNVGYIVHQTVGYSQDLDFEAPALQIPPDLSLSELRGKARFSRTAKGILLQAYFQATLAIECVRCLETFKQVIEANFTELYAFTPDAATDQGPVLPENGILDLTPLVREEMLLAIPSNPVCKPGCKGLCPLCGENLNLTTCYHEEDQIDPRFAILRTLQQK